MTDRPTWVCCTVLALLALAALSLTSCESMRATPRQDYVWAMWDQCKSTDELRTSTVGINRVEPDGRYWSSVTAGPFEVEWPRVQACMNEQFKAHPYLDWFKTRQASVPPSLTADIAAANIALTGPIAVPVWRVGDEWHYAYKSPSDSGAYVWSVNRLESLDGVQHYVVKGGTREILYRVSDLASSLERVDGVVVVRHTPPRLSYSWPLAPGKTWEQESREERPVARQTTNRDSVWAVDAEETVAVPAGTFRTLKIVWRNRNTRALLYEMWYAPAVKQWVKIREALSSGFRERELVSFKLK
jgi:hypothetical protein